MERRLRTIYDALDNANYKSAIKLATQQLAKRGDVTEVAYLKTLKALALGRTGKNKEGLQLMAEVKAQIDNINLDEYLMNTIMMVYRESRKVSEVASYYEHAFEKSPTLEYAQGMFNTYARLYDFKKLQLAATKLNKNFQSDKYILAAITAMLLQIPRQHSGQHMLLTLSERMLTKEEEKLTTYDKLYLLLSALIQQQKYGEALDILGRESTAKCFTIEWERKKLRAELLAKLGKWEECAAVYEDLLRAYSGDDWSFINGYLDATMEMAKASGSGMDSVWSKASSLFADLSKAESEGGLCQRGPYLASVELESRKLRSAGTKDAAGLMKSMVDYFKRFGTKLCAYSDLKPYIYYVDDGKREEFIKLVKDACSECLEEGGESLDGNKKVLLKCNVSKFERSAGLHAKLQKPEHKVMYAEQMFLSFVDSLTAVDKLEDKERGCGEDYLLLAAHLLNDLCKADGNLNVEAFSDCVNILEIGIADRQYSHQFKLLLVQMYLSIGAVKPAYDLMQSMDVKHIQMDTLTYLVFDDLYRLGHFADARQLCHSISRLHNDNNVATGDAVVLGFKEQTYSTIRKLAWFYERLETSHQRALNQIEAARFNVLDNLDNCEELNGYMEDHGESLLTDAVKHVDRLVFNADKNILYDFDAPKIAPHEDLERLSAPIMEDFGEPQRYVSARPATEEQKMEVTRRRLKIELLSLVFVGHKPDITEGKISAKLDDYKSVLAKMKLGHLMQNFTDMDLSKEGSQKIADHLHSLGCRLGVALFEGSLAMSQILQKEDNCNEDEAKTLTGSVLKSIQTMSGVLEGMQKGVDAGLYRRGSDCIEHRVLGELVSVANVELAGLSVAMGHWADCLGAVKGKRRDTSMGRNIVALRESAKPLIKSALDAVTAMLGETEKKSFGIPFASSSSLGALKEQESFSTIRAECEKKIRSSYKESLSSASTALKVAQGRLRSAKW